MRCTSLSVTAESKSDAWVERTNPRQRKAILRRDYIVGGSQETQAVMPLDAEDETDPAGRRHDDRVMAKVWPVVIVVVNEAECPASTCSQNLANRVFLVPQYFLVLHHHSVRPSETSSRQTSLSDTQAGVSSMYGHFLLCVDDSRFEVSGGQQSHWSADVVHRMQCH